MRWVDFFELPLENRFVTHSCGEESVELIAHLNRVDEAAMSSVASRLDELVHGD